MNDLAQYQDLYIQTGKEYVQSLNASLLKLEKNNIDKTAIEEIFRSAHSLKSQSAAMGYESTGYLCHVIEDIFYEIKNDRLPLGAELADHLFKAFDGLADSLQRIEKESQEADLSGLAAALKQFAGITSTGAGKTGHSAEQSAASSASPPSLAVPTLLKTPPTTPEIATEALDESPKVTIATIAVKVDELDEILNLVENLLVEQLKLKRIGRQAADQTILKDYINASEKILVSLQYQIMKVRAVPVSLVFNHFPRAVRDLARAENKQIEMVITGGDLELDRTIVERLSEPLTHLLRNAVSHGIKDKGTITLSAGRQKDSAQISVSDDGQGIAWQQVAQKAGLPPGETSQRILKEALFSGITTSQTVTQISGRGVGLTVIKKMVDSLGGSIDVVSEPGRGAAFTITLPLTLSIAKALIVIVSQKYFAIPALLIEHLVNVPAASVRKIADQEAFSLNGTEIPLVRLATKLAPLGERPPAEIATPKDLTVVVVANPGEKVGLVVDAVRDTTDIVIKPVPDVVKSVPGFSGVTVLGDGQTALIINPQELT